MVDELNKGLAEDGYSVVILGYVVAVEDHQDDVKGYDVGGRVGFD